MEENNTVSSFVDEEILNEYGVLTIHFVDEKIEDIPKNYFKRRFSSEYITTKKIINTIIKNKDSLTSVTDFYLFISKELDKEYIDDQLKYLKKFKDFLQEYSIEYRIKAKEQTILS